MSEPVHHPEDRRAPALTPLPDHWPDVVNHAYVDGAALGAALELERLRNAA